jgi:hypothetical protein
MQIETRMMPGATHGIADNEAFAKRTAVVSALSADGKYLRAAP